MSIPLDAVTHARLLAMAEQRRRLVRRRGVAASLLTLIAALAGGAAVDRVFLLPDEGRWALSAGVYLLVAAGIWRYWLRPALHPPDWGQLARWIESACPALREDLLSAVELGTQGAGADLDSPEFRALLQTSVGERMAAVDPVEVLPPRLVRSWMILAGVALITFVGLFMIREIHFGRLIARTLLPMANIERVSSTHLTILAPDPPDVVVPQGDTVIIRVAASGPAPRTAELELSRAGRRTESIEMLSTGAGAEFQAAVQTDEHAVNYRIQARDGQTRRFTITPRLRPYVTSFDVAYNFPAYMRRPPLTVAAARRGDLTAFAGTAAKLTLHTDQPIREAIVEMDQGGRFTRVPVQIDSPRQLSLMVPVEADGEYRIMLVAAETGFDNGKFSPRYEIRAVPDELPVVRMVEPAKDLLVAPDEIITIIGQAFDDVGLARVSHLVSVNEGPWRDLPLTASATMPSGERVAVPLRASWDLASLGVKPGDRLATKLAAADLKGSVGESAPVKLLIASASFSPGDTRPLAARRAVLELLRQFERVSADSAAAAREVAGNLDPDDPARLGESLARCRSAAGRVEQEAVTLQETLIEAIRVSSGGAGGWELAALGAAISRIQREYARGALERVETAVALRESGWTRDAFHRAADSMANAERDARELREIAVELVISDEAAMLSRDLVELQREQERIARSPGGDEAATVRWVRRQKLVVDYLKSMEARFSDLAGRYPGPAADAGRRQAERLRALRESLSIRISTAEAARVLPADKGKPAEQARDLRGQWLGFDGEQANRAAGQRYRLADKLPPAEQLIHELVERAREAADQSRNVGERIARGDSREEIAGDDRRLKELESGRDRRWRTLAQLYADRARLEEARPDHDPAFVADLDLMYRALKAVHTWPLEDERVLKSLLALNGAFRVLDTGHGLAELAISLESLATRERWEFSTPEALVVQPRLGDFAGQFFNVLPDRLQPAGFPGHARERLLRIREGAPWKESIEQMNRRRWSLEAPVRADDKLARVARDVAELQRDVQWRMDQARKLIAEAVPSLSEMMAGLAEQAERARDQSLDSAAELDRRPQEAATAVDAARRDQAELAEGVRDLQNALRRQANRQDISTPAGRERARDADDAIELVDRPLAGAQEAVERAASSPQAEEQARHLARAADRQGDLAASLRRLARHEQLLEQNSDVTASRAELRAAERELGIAESLDERYAEAERMAALSELAPEDQIAALERQLPGNDTMREALSAVARESLDQARQRLEQASEQEGAVSSRLEQPVAEERRRRDELAERLANVGRRGGEMAANELKSVRDRAAKGEVAAQDQMGSAEQNLREAQAAAQGNADRSIEDVAENAKTAAAEFSAAAEDMKRSADAARRAGQAAERAGPNSRPRAEAAGQAAQQASAMSERLQGLAQEARQIAQEAAKRTPVPRELSNSQDAVARSVGAAEEALQRAARMEERGGGKDVAAAIGQLAEEIAELRPEEIAGAAAALRGQGAGKAAAAVDQARQAIDQHLARMQRPAMESANPTHRQTSGEAASPQEAVDAALARAMARLDEAVHPGESAGRGEEGARTALAEAGALMRSAMAAGARGMRQARASGRPQHGQARVSEGFVGDSTTGATVESPSGGDAGSLPEVGRAAGSTTWGKLPPRLAQDLMTGRREKVAEEYRDMVDTYFKVIAERAKDGAK